MRRARTNVRLLADQAEQPTFLRHAARASVRDADPPVQKKAVPASSRSRPARSSTLSRSCWRSPQDGHTVLVTWLVLAGLMLGFARTFIIEAAGV